MIERARGAMLLGWLTACGAAAPHARVAGAETRALPDAAIPCAGESTIDVRDHDLALSLSLDPPAIAGSGTVSVTARSATEVAVLDARRLDVRAVHDGVRPLSFRRHDDRLCIQLASPLGPGRALTLHLAWTAATDGKVPRVEGGAMWAGYRTSAWMPTLQDPAQRATLRLRIRAPRTLEVVASGRAVAPPTREGGFRVHAFALAQPTPAFLYAFAAGRFARREREVDGLTLRSLGPSASALEPAQERAGELLRVFRNLLGVPFPGDAYTQVFVPEDAAQEAAGLALLSARTLDDLRADPYDDWLLSHELAHQWFAWLVPCADFADFWLNEGFATFLVGIAKERREGSSAYEAERARWLVRSAAVHDEGRDAPLSRSAPGVTSPPASEAELPPRGVTYMRGALVLDRLRRTLGEAAFWRGIRAYLRAQAGRPTRSEDLRRALEDASGRDLAGFFATWVYAPAWDF